MLTDTQKKTVEAYMGFAITVARAITRDPDADSVAMLALCTAVIKYDEKPRRVDIKGYIRGWVKAKVYQSRQKVLVTNCNLDSLPAREERDTRMELPPHLADVGRLYFGECQSIPDVAEVLGKTEHFVSKKIRQIKKLVASRARQDFHR